ncbi:hypothetical protein U1Q18_000158 [Sarracenia purpurea var. burkii]
MKIKLVHGDLEGETEDQFWISFEETTSDTVGEGGDGGEACIGELSHGTDGSGRLGDGEKRRWQAEAAASTGGGGQRRRRAQAVAIPRKGRRKGRGGQPVGA